MSFKRVFVATLMGILAGVVCCLLASSGGEPMSKKLLLNIFTGRVLIGFVIGISAWKMHWALHGILMGLIVSIPAGFGSMMSTNPDFDKYTLFFMTVVMGIVYGFVIELVTSVIFKAKQT